MSASRKSFDEKGKFTSLTTIMTMKNINLTKVSFNVLPKLNLIHFGRSVSNTLGTFTALQHMPKAALAPMQAAATARALHAPI